MPMMYAHMTARVEKNPLMTFDEIYEANAGRILNLAYRMTGRETLARDIVQDVFLKVYQNMENFREESQISTWVYRIALNHIINVLKKEKRLRFFDDRAENSAYRRLAETESVWENEAPRTADRRLEQQEREKLIRAMMEKLNPKYRIPLLLYRYEEMSYQEIAEKLGLSLSAVETRIYRARKKLADYLKPWLPYI